MIKPTVGRVVWFRHLVDAPSGHDASQPCDAHVLKVNEDGTVNLMVFGQMGGITPFLGVVLRQEGEALPQGNYCEWMPYQVGQAAKEKDSYIDRGKPGLVESAVGLKPPAGEPKPAVFPGMLKK